MAIMFRVPSLFYAQPWLPGQTLWDSAYRSGPQQIPGRVELAYYDLGGEGVAYHDSMAANEGAARTIPPVTGAPSPPISPSSANEGVDISYTRTGPTSTIPQQRSIPGQPTLYRLGIQWRNGTNYTVNKVLKLENTGSSRFMAIATINPNLVEWEKKPCTGTARRHGQLALLDTGHGW